MEFTFKLNEELLGNRYTTISKNALNKFDMLESATKSTLAILMRLLLKYKLGTSWAPSFQTEGRLNLIPSKIELYNPIVELNNMVPLQEHMNIWSKSRIIDPKFVIDRINEIYNRFESGEYNIPKTIVFVGLGGYNSHTIANIIYLKKLINRWIGDKDSVYVVDYKKLYINQPSTKDIYEALNKLDKILDKIFYNSKLYVYEPDSVEVSNIIRFPYSSLDIGKPKIKYFAPMLKELENVFRCKIYGAIEYLTENEIKEFEEKYDGNFKVIGAISPKLRYRFSKILKDKFIFTGHFNNEYQITNDYTFTDIITEDDITVIETYGNINLTTFLVNMFASVFDIIDILTLPEGQYKNIERNFVDIVNIEETMLIEFNNADQIETKASSIEDSMNVYAPEGSLYAEFMDMIKNASEDDPIMREYRSIYGVRFLPDIFKVKNKVDLENIDVDNPDNSNTEETIIKIVPLDEYKTKVTENINVLNRNNIKFLILPMCTPTILNNNNNIDDIFLSSMVIL